MKDTLHLGKSPALWALERVNIASSSWNVAEPFYTKQELEKATYVYDYILNYVSLRLHLRKMKEIMKTWLITKSNDNQHFLLGTWVSFTFLQKTCRQFSWLVLCPRNLNNGYWKYIVSMQVCEIDGVVKTGICKSELDTNVTREGIKLKCSHL